MAVVATSTAAKLMVCPNIKGHTPATVSLPVSQCPTPAWVTSYVAAGKGPKGAAGQQSMLQLFKYWISPAGVSQNNQVKALQAKGIQPVYVPGGPVTAAPPAPPLEVALVTGGYSAYVKAGGDPNNPLFSSAGNDAGVLQAYTKANPTGSLAGAAAGAAAVKTYQTAVAATKAPVAGVSVKAPPIEPPVPVHAPIIPVTVKAAAPPPAAAPPAKAAAPPVVTAAGTTVTPTTAGTVIAAAAPKPTPAVPAAPAISTAPASSSMVTTLLTAGLVIGALIFIRKESK
jgi:hypothetical protein